MSPSSSKSSSLIGKAKELEVASTLVANGVYVFFPLVDAGFDLIAANRTGTEFVPVQVKFRERDPALNLLPKDVVNFTGTNVVVAWVIGSGPRVRQWFIPFREWQTKAKAPNRKDGLAYITIGEHAEWLAQFEGETGVRRAFAKLFV
ncbi:MAG TPA: hypothetical protein VFV71_03700 [Burkholderiales bacterium]|nr:hypothetical protein [Burkholderiales bacterium]